MSECDCSNVCKQFGLSGVCKAMLRSLNVSFPSSWVPWVGWLARTLCFEITHVARKPPEKARASLIDTVFSAYIQVMSLIDPKTQRKLCST